MALSTTTPLAKGKILAVTPTGVIFAPSNSNYELALTGTYTGPLDTLVYLRLFATGRKLLTVPTGGLFLTPIKGPPKVIQGRVVSADSNTLVVHAVVPVTITLPQDDAALDLSNGYITAGQMVNLTLLPGARFELAEAPAI